MIIRKRSLLKDVLEALPDPELSKGALPLLQKLREAAREIEADTVLLAVGMKPRNEEAWKFLGCCPESNFFVIGDCQASGDIRDAVHGAFDSLRYF